METTVSGSRGPDFVIGFLALVVCGLLLESVPLYESPAVLRLTIALVLLTAGVIVWMNLLIRR